MTSIKSSSELKSLARTQLIGNYSTTSFSFFMAFLVHMVLSDIVSFLCDSSTPFGMVLEMIVSIIISVFMCVFAFGFAAMYLNLSCKKRIHTSLIFEGFKNRLNQNLFVSLKFMATVVIPICIGEVVLSFTSLSGNPFIIILGYLILVAAIIFGFYMALQYSLVFFISLDFPQYDSNKIFKMSVYLMKGQKGRLLYMIASFLPLYLLSFLSFPIGILFTVGLLWIGPYMMATFTNFYLNLVRSKSQ